MRLTDPAGMGGAQRHELLRYTLLSTPLLDELAFGFPVLALPLLVEDLGLSYTQAGLIFTTGEVSSLVLEPALNIFSDSGSKRLPVLGGMLCLAAGFALVASAPNLAWLLLAFAIIYPASGAAVGLSQAALVDDALDEAPRTMTRWTLLASVGDLFAPPVVATVIALGFGWRPLFWLAAALWLGAAVLLWRQKFPARATAPASDDADPPFGMRSALRQAVSNPLLLRWVAVVVLSSLLDEIFLGFAGLYLTEIISVDPATVSLVLGVQLAGSMLGLVILDRLLGHFSPEGLLRVMTIVALGGVLAFLLAPSVWLAAGALFVLGVGVAGWYPLAQSAAYAVLPGRSGTVRAVIVALGAPVAVGLPVAVGWVGERFGITAAVGLLGLAPLMVLLVAPTHQ